MIWFRGTRTGNLYRMTGRVLDELDNEKPPSDEEEDEEDENRCQG